MVRSGHRVLGSMNRKDRSRTYEMLSHTIRVTIRHYHVIDKLITGSKVSGVQPHSHFEYYFVFLLLRSRI
jgi:hypothetical protein